VDGLIAEIATSHAALAQELSQWSHQFRFDKMLEWIEALSVPAASVADISNISDIAISDIADISDVEQP
jgi:hypothetical protein